MTGSSDYTLRVMDNADAQAVSELADLLVGQGYYPPTMVCEYIQKATTADITTAYVALDPHQIVAFRFVFPPGSWDAGRGRGLCPDQWPAPMERAAYFQSCFVHHAHMGRGLGRRLAMRAIDDLHRCGAQIVVAHSWKESPHGSSFRYLSRLGFEPVQEHPRYWSEVDYICQLDGKPCQCTAIEMVLNLQDEEA